MSTKWDAAINASGDSLQLSPEGYIRVFGVKPGKLCKMRIMRTEGLEEVYRHAIQTESGSIKYAPCAKDECSSVKIAATGLSLHSYPGVLYGGTWGWEYERNVPAIFWFPRQRVWNALFNYLKLLIESGQVQNADITSLLYQALVCVSGQGKGQFNVQCFPFPPEPSAAEINAAVSAVKDKMEIELTTPPSAAVSMATLSRYGVTSIITKEFDPMGEKPVGWPTVTPTTTTNVNPPNPFTQTPSLLITTPEPATDGVVPPALNPFGTTQKSVFDASPNQTNPFKSNPFSNNPAQEALTALETE